MDAPKYIYIYYTATCNPVISTWYRAVKIYFYFWQRLYSFSGSRQETFYTGHTPSIYFNLHLYRMKGDLKVMCIPYGNKHAVRRRWWRNTDSHPPLGLRNLIRIILILCIPSEKFVHIICTDTLLYPQQIFQVLTQLQFVQCVSWHLWD